MTDELARKGRPGVTRYIVFFGDEDPDELDGKGQPRGIEKWHPIAVGCYVNREKAMEAIRIDQTWSHHEELDFTMLYRGSPGTDLEFVGRGSDLVRKEKT